jgi:FixJ family two-component response regulator
MSGYAEKDIVHDGVLEPGIQFLAKPFTSEDLLAVVDAAVTQTAVDQHARPRAAAARSGRRTRPLRRN